MPSNWSEQWIPKIQKILADAPSAPSSVRADRQPVDINSQSQINQVVNEYDTGRRLRQYQQESAMRSLRSNLNTLDRSVMDQYKNVSNDYAARGMLRSGGYLGASDRVTAAGNEQASGALQNLQDLLQQNNITDTGAQGNANSNIQAIIANYLASQAANKVTQTGSTN